MLERGSQEAGLLAPTSSTGERIGFSRTMGQLLLFLCTSGAHAKSAGDTVLLATQWMQNECVGHLPNKALQKELCSNTHCYQPDLLMQPAPCYSKQQSCNY